MESIYSQKDFTVSDTHLKIRLATHVHWQTHGQKIMSWIYLEHIQILIAILVCSQHIHKSILFLNQSKYNIATYVGIKYPMVNRNKASSLIHKLFLLKPWVSKKFVSNDGPFNITIKNR